MDSGPSSNSNPGQRTLAAVVFTDVVGFSARMGTDEVGTIKLLNRDFAEMRRLCTEHGGNVLKTTGDGLLLTFSSAVHAVACALAMQRQFAEEAKDKPGALQHRVGIHLGDILFHNQDVMGDGVNIASRLQSEAEPGGICISQTVYDVVKNKVKMQAVSVGAKELKNISEAIPVYRILLEAQALASGSRAPAFAEPTAGRPGGSHATPTTLVKAPAKSKGAGLWIGVGVAVVAIGVAAVVVLRPKTEPAAVQVQVPVQAPASSAVSTPAPAEPAPMTDDEFNKEVARRQDQLKQARTQFLEKYDFAGFSKELKDSKSPQGTAAAQAMIRSADSLVAMKDWLDFVIVRYQRNRPLVVPDLGGTAAEMRVIGAIGNKFSVLDGNGAPTPPKAWTDFTPPVMASIIVAAIRDTRPQPQREVLLGARAFGQFFNLPAMTEAMNTMLGPQTGNRQGLNAARQGQGQTPARQGQLPRRGQ